ncbi:MAG: class I SAM-dependent RNA methyltransferase, partial [Anaerolineales bacterium]|nr:class I SAM-dependent RNA methyltransferase [Anaerolineales bacterium]
MHIPPDNIIVELTTQAYGGETLGRLPDGRAVFVPFALPGEVVRVRLIEEKRRYARAELVEVLTVSPQRIEPLCTHFTRCGGCHYQHMPYGVQLEAKTKILKDQLERLGKIDAPEVKPAVPAAAQYHYRNNIQFELTEQGSLGFHSRPPGELFAVQECHLPEEALNHLWPQLHFEEGSGLQRVGLRLGSGEDILLTLESDHPQPPDFLVEDLPIAAVFLSPEVMHVLAGDNFIFIEVLERSFRVSAGTFFQVNTRMAAAMVEHILSNLTLEAGDTVIDAYAGVGLFSAFLAAKVKRLIAVEESPQACADFTFNLDEFDNVELYQAKVEQVLPSIEVKPKAILVDPPRSGLDRAALDGILSLLPELVVYVSCDAATLARDVRRLSAGGYRLASATPFDLFPQTFHVETVCFL